MKAIKPVIGEWRKDVEDIMTELIQENIVSVRDAICRTYRIDCQRHGNTVLSPRISKIETSAPFSGSGCGRRSTSTAIFKRCAKPILFYLPQKHPFTAADVVLPNEWRTDKRRKKPAYITSCLFHLLRMGKINRVHDKFIFVSEQSEEREDMQIESETRLASPMKCDIQLTHGVPTQPHLVELQRWSTQHFQSPVM